MDENKLNAVRSYLIDDFSNSIIEEKYDFDRVAQTFRIRIGKNLLLLKVGEEFLEDNTEIQIRTHLENWKVGDLLRKNKERGIFVGNSVPMYFNRFA